MIKYIQGFTLILFTAVFSFLSNGSESSNGIDIQEYTYENFEKSIEQAIFESKESFDLYYGKGLTENRIEKAADRILESNYFSNCLLKDIEAVYEEHKEYSSIDIRLIYKEDINLPIYVAENEGEVVRRLIEGWGLHQDKVTVIANKQEYSEDKIFSLMDTAEINSAMIPCEAERVMYEAFPKAGDWQIIHMWLEFPIGEKELSDKQEELEKAVLGYAEQIDIENIRNAEEGYRKVYDILVNFAKYDNAIAILSNMQRLDLDMYINRSAYGGLVSGKTICNGYARGYKAICDEMGLPCWVVVGTKDGEKHSWNMVMIDNEKYYIDCTFGSYGKAKINDTFMLSEDRLLELNYELSDYFFIPDDF